MSDASSGIWHDGRELVVRMASPRFPQRCIKSGKPIGAGLTSIDVVDAPQFERWNLRLRLPLSPSWQEKEQIKGRGRDPGCERDPPSCLRLSGNLRTRVVLVGAGLGVDRMRSGAVLGVCPVVSDCPRQGVVRRLTFGWREPIGTSWLACPSGPGRRGRGPFGGRGSSCKSACAGRRPRRCKHSSRQASRPR